MKTRSIEISRLFSTGDFENVKIGYVIDLEEGDDLDVVRRDILTQIDKDYDLVNKRKAQSHKYQNELWDLERIKSELESLIKDPNLIDPNDDLPF